MQWYSYSRKKNVKIKKDPFQLKNESNFFYKEKMNQTCKDVFGSMNINGWNMDIYEYRVFGWMDKLNLDIHNREYSG